MFSLPKNKCGYSKGMMIESCRDLFASERPMTSTKPNFPFFKIVDVIVVSRFLFNFLSQSPCVSKSSVDKAKSIKLSNSF